MISRQTFPHLGHVVTDGRWSTRHWVSDHLLQLPLPVSSRGARSILQIVGRYWILIRQERDRYIKLVYCLRMVINPYYTSERSPRILFKKTVQSQAIVRYDAMVQCALGTDLDFRERERENFFHERTSSIKKYFKNIFFQKTCSCLTFAPFSLFKGERVKVGSY